jgi:hypothetical protein
MTLELGPGSHAGVSGLSGYFAEVHVAFKGSSR